MTPWSLRKALPAGFAQKLERKLKDAHYLELLKGGYTAFVLKTAGGIVGYLLALLITRTLGAFSMGVFALSLTVLNIGGLAGKLGLNSMLLKLAAEYSALGRWDLIKAVHAKAMRIMVPLNILLSALLFLFAPLLAGRLFHKPEIAAHLRIAAVALLPAAIHALNSEGLRGIKKIREFSSLVELPNLFAIGALSVLLLFSRSSRLPVAAYVLGVAAAALVSQVLWARHSPSSNQGARAGISNGRLMGLAVPMMLSTSALFIMHWTDTLMLGIYRPEAEVGVFNICSKVSSVTSMAIISVNTIAAPKFAELWGKRDIASLRKVVRQSTKLIFWASAPVLLAITLLPGPILGLFGGEFRSGSRALLILLLGRFVNSLCGPVGILLTVTERQKLFQNIIFLAAALNIGLNLVLIPRYGITGASMASTISTVLWNFTCVYFVRAHFRFTTIYLPFRRFAGGVKTQGA